MQFESWRIFKAAKKHLAPGSLQRIFTKTTRLIDMWAANPAHCECTARNPIDRIRALLDELDTAGCEQYARAAIDYMAEPLGGHFELFSEQKSDKGTIDGEIADLFAVSGRFAEALREAAADGVLTTQERILIVDNARSVVSEINQALAAAGMKGV